MARSSINFSYKKPPEKLLLSLSAFPSEIIALAKSLHRSGLGSQQSF